ncbi:hypothetical protein EG327_003394 [Venturia inaequalis]|uniref:Fe2OG dioxygenase domain-containing protein n=1 Tax=Venturia inaequalis TaxID=5025 RepID=A0A8H3VI32_VENIN|nr:hypothetical protein EG327_003394 [Venturia inaequalis]
MDAFVSRKRRRFSPEIKVEANQPLTAITKEQDDESTDFKLAMLASVYPDLDQSLLLDILLVENGSVEAALDNLNKDSRSSRKKQSNSGVGYQASLTFFNIGSSSTKKQTLTKKGKTLHLYSPDDIAANTPCSIIHNFLQKELADALLRELLQEAPTFQRERFKMFDRVSESPHTMCFYVDSEDAAEIQRTQYVYMGDRIADVRPSLPKMREVSSKVQVAVNAENEKRIRDFYPGGKKLQYQSPDEWKPNAAFVNCYDGGQESVGYHADQLTYLGPRAIIGSLSLGVSREFRVRRIISKDEDEPANKSRKKDDADAEGQIAIHLPHNSLLVMHAEMQEEWKHSIAPAQSIDPHPIAKNKRLNITYRWYKDALHPKYTPRCGSSNRGIFAFILSGTSRPFHLIDLYGVPGIFLWLFGSRTTWKAEVQVLSQVRDDDTMQFKKSVLDECSMVSIAAAIVAEISITALSLEGLNQTHWLAKGLFLFSLVDALMAVYYATTHQRSMGRLLHPKQVRSWIRGGVGPKEAPGYISPLLTRTRKDGKDIVDAKDVDVLLGAWESRTLDLALQIHGIQLDLSPCDPQDLDPIHAKMLTTSLLSLRHKCFTPSVASVVMISAPQALLTASLFSLLMAIFIYRGFKRIYEVNSIYGSYGDRNVFILFIVGLVLCILVYSTSGLIQDRDAQSEQSTLDCYMGDWAKRNAKLLSVWGLRAEFDDEGVRKFVQVETAGEGDGSGEQVVPLDLDGHAIQSPPTMDV